MRICVFCGASPDTPNEFLALAHKVGKILGKTTNHVVYGGGAWGMMGSLADGVLEAEGNIIGVLPKFLFEREPPHSKVSDMRVVDNMHERKALMYELSDAFMVLPGGFGTMDETMEVITWRQLAIHDKPVTFISENNFWQGIESTFNLMRENKFLSERDRNLISFHNSAELAANALKEQLSSKAD